MKTIGLVLTLIMYLAILALLYPRWDDYNVPVAFSFTCSVLNWIGVVAIAVYIPTKFYKWFKSNIK